MNQRDIACLLHQPVWESISDFMGVTIRDLFNLKGWGALAVNGMARFYSRGTFDSPSDIGGPDRACTFHIGQCAVDSIRVVLST